MAAKSGVIYLLKDRFQMYSPFLPRVVEFRFVPEIVRDLDVINKELLDNLIKMFVTNGKIQPSNLTIVLADNAYFTKDFVLPQQPQQKGAPKQPEMTMESIQVLSLDFIEHVPYENVVSKTLSVKNGLKVCAANKDFFSAIKDAFEKIGFTIDSVYPVLVLGPNYVTKPVLDGDLVNAISQKGPSLKEYDLLKQDVYVPEPKKGKGTETNVEMELEDFKETKDKPDKKRLFFMVGFLAFLLIILGVVYNNSLNEQPPPPKAKQVATVSEAPPVEVSPVVSEAPSDEATPSPEEEEETIDKEEAKLLTVQLTNSSASPAQVEKLRTALGTFGFASMNTSSNASLNSAQTIVIFSLIPSAEMKAAVLREVKKITPTVQVQEKNDASDDITILLGK